MRGTVTLLLISAFAATTAFAQETSASQSISTEERIENLESEISRLKKFSVSGYIQGQYQWGQGAASLKTGAANENPEKSFDRFGIRRGRIKFTYGEEIASAVFQLDVTEKGVGIKDAYLNLRDPWIKSLQLRAGVFDRPFGYEISYSSSRRESPERSTVFQTLFPDERDLGAMLVLQAPLYSPWNILKLEAGLFAGNGIKQETDSKKDFIGHLSIAKEWKNISFGAGVSYYNGKVYQGTANIYTMDGSGFALNGDAANTGKFAVREYLGFDARFGIQSMLGKTQLRGEYLFGRQPGTADGSKSPNASSLPSYDTYIRNFSGGYVMLVHDIAGTPIALIAKYDWYDPNTKVSNNEIGRTGTNTGKGDISKNTLGFGALWNLSPALRLTAYYEVNRNERSANLTGFDKDIKDDVFTLRLQYKF